MDFADALSQQLTVGTGLGHKSNSLKPPHSVRFFVTLALLLLLTSDFNDLEKNRLR
jgi:hypothetical protein